MQQPIVSPDEFREAVIHALVSRLGDLGKIKIQKLVYFLQEAYRLPLGCRFYLHYYGPYSEEVETGISNLKFMGYVNVQADPEGYGFHVTRTSSSGEPGWTTVIRNAESEVDSAVQGFGLMDASQLELAATIHYVRRSFGFNKGDVIASVRSRKPKFSRKLISDAYDSLASMNLL
jgi:uncharacterized protein YwgA